MRIGLAMLDPHADGAEQLAAGVQHLSKAEAKLRFLPAQHAHHRPHKRPYEGCTAVDEHPRLAHAACDAGKRSTVAVPEIDVELISERGALRRFILIDEPAFRKADVEPRDPRRAE